MSAPEPDPLPEPQPPAPPINPLPDLQLSQPAPDPSPEKQFSQSDQFAADVYQQLRRLARQFLLGERVDHTLQPTALVHEAYLRLHGANQPWTNQSHFLQVAASCMRRILIDHARKRASQKRKADTEALAFDDNFLSAASPLEPEQLLDLDRALHKLAGIMPRQARAMEMHFFGGYSEEDIARVLEVSSRTIKRDIAIAKAWLHKEMKPKRDR